MFCSFELFCWFRRSDRRLNYFVCRMILGNYMSRMSDESQKMIAAAMLISVPWNVFVGTKSLEKPILNYLINRHLAFCLVRTIKELVVVAVQIDYYCFYFVCCLLFVVVVVANLVSTGLSLTLTFFFKMQTESNIRLHPRFRSNC